MKHYLIAGGAGFIGSHLTDHLIASGHQVTVIDNFSAGQYVHPQAKTIKADILDINSIKSYFAGIDGCFNLVGIPSVVVGLDNWFDLHNVNLQGSLNILKLAIESGGVPVVYASSCAVYGQASELPLSEDLAVYPISAYGCDKLALEKNAYFCSQAFKLPTMGLRFFNVYGPRQNPMSPYAAVICNFISHLKNNQPVIIYGDGSQTRDFIFVQDIVQGLLHAMATITTDAAIVNLSTEVSISIMQLAKLTSQLVGTELNIIHKEPRIFDVQHSLGSTKKMKSLGFNCTYDLETGLRETIDFMQLEK